MVRVGPPEGGPSAVVPKSGEPVVCWIAASDTVLWSRMRPRMGFALVFTTLHAGVRAQKRNARFDWAPPIVRFAAPTRVLDN